MHSKATQDLRKSNHVLSNLFVGNHVQISPPDGHAAGWPVVMPFHESVAESLWPVLKEAAPFVLEEKPKCQVQPVALVQPMSVEMAR